MSDGFKDYLTENADRLSPEEPGEHVWVQIQKRRAKKSWFVVPLLVKRIAAACILPFICLAVYKLLLTENVHRETGNPVTAGNAKSDTSQKFLPTHKTDQQKLRETTTVQKRQPIKETASQKIKLAQKNNQQVAQSQAQQKFVYMPGEELALHYQDQFGRMIENEKTKISTTPVYGVTQAYFEIYLTDYQLMERDEERIKNKIKLTGGSLEALDEMIINFQRRIDLLKRLRAEIERKNLVNANRKDLPTNYIRIL